MAPSSMNLECVQRALTGQDEYLYRIISLCLRHDVYHCHVHGIGERILLIWTIKAYCQNPLFERRDYKVVCFCHHFFSSNFEALWHNQTHSTHPLTN